MPRAPPKSEADGGTVFVHPKLLPRQEGEKASREDKHPLQLWVYRTKIDSIAPDALG